MAAAASVLRCAGDTDPGRERENNEDRFLIDSDRGIFIVIDGIGGQAAGEVAADTALSLLQRRMQRQTGTVVERLREGITLANNEIFRLAQSNEEWQGMACVLTAAVVDNSNLTVGHVGDTRLYKIRGGEIRKITPDHSPIGVREDAGEITETEAMQHPRRNEVYRDVGSSEHTPDDSDFIEIIEAKFESDSALLLCSDGLTDLVPSSRILQIVRERGNEPTAAVRDLIHAANEAGGKDNITAILVEGESFVSFSNGSRKLSAIAEPTDTQAVDSTAPQYTSTFLSGPARLVRKLATTRWAFLVYGAVIALVMSIVIQKLFGLAVIPTVKPPVSSREVRSFVVNQHGESQFASIGEALARAQPGDTIEVAPGEYREHIKLKSGVSLISLVPRGAIIIPVRSESGQSVAIEATGIESVRLIGFKILGNTEYPLSVGLQITDATITVEELEVSGSSDAGIEITGQGLSILRANSVHDNSGVGILMRGPMCRPRLVGNLLVRNGKTTDTKKPGIELLERARPDLFDNYLSENGVVGIVGLPDGSKDEVNEKNILGPPVPANKDRKRTTRGGRR